MAALTRAQAEAVLVDRCGPWMTRAKMAVTKDGTNTWLNDPIAQALSQTGYAVADPFAVTDADLAGLDLAADLYEFLDRAELCVLRTVETRLPTVSIMIEGIQVLNSDQARQIHQMVSEKTKQVNANWDRPSGGLGVGILSLDFAQALPDCEGE